MKDFMGDATVLFQGHGEDEDVIQIDSYLSSGHKVSEDGVYEGLEGGW